MASALAEFQIALTFADAPIDRYARGVGNALTPSQKQGALLFFGRAGCVECHAVSGQSNEMFSDFENRVAGVPQIAPFFGVGEANMIFDGPGEDEDFGLEQITGNPADRYRFMAEMNASAAKSQAPASAPAPAAPPSSANNAQRRGLARAGAEAICSSVGTPSITASSTGNPLPSSPDTVASSTSPTSSATCRSRAAGRC